MDLHLENKVFIVTGGAKGIGEAITRELASEGAIPVIVGRSAKEALQVSKELSEKGGTSHVITCELGKDSCEHVVKETVEKFGRIDGLVNNAGVNDGVGLASGCPTSFVDSLHKNLTHYYDMAHFCLPYLKEAKGAIINVSSKTALTGQGETSAYAASKGAQLALTREWAVELAPYSVRVNAIVPAEVMTPLYESWLSTFDDPKEKLASITSKIPYEKRMTSTKEIASMTVFLLSDRSSHTTGQWIFPDGGYTHLDRAIT